MRRPVTYLVLVLLALLLVCPAGADVPGNTTQTDVLSSPAKSTGKKKEEEDLAVVTNVIALGTTYLLSYILDRCKITILPEALVGILVGMGASYLLQFFSTDAEFNVLVRFNPDFFYLVLLPPIIFEAGYNMRQRPFFYNIGAICMYAFAGTLISAFVIGGLVYYAGQLGWCYQLSGLASLVFGALISATDPVTVLAVFQKQKVRMDLYSLVFGEAVLNDAVAIVLVNTLLMFKDAPVTTVSVCLAIVSFIWTFLGSLFIGVLVAVLSACMYKTFKMYEDKEYLTLEVSILLLFPYSSFLIAEGAGLSGIVSILFCGMVMRQYTYWNLSDAAQVQARGLLKVLSFLAESFVFVYLGMSVFTFPIATTEHLKLVVIIFIVMLVARACNVYPCTWIVNKFRSEDTQISYTYQFVMWFSGLRGAVAFVIATTTWLDETFDKRGDDTAVLTCTLVMAVATVATFGSMTSYLLGYLGLKGSGNAPEVIDHGNTQRRQLNTKSIGSLVRFEKYFIKPLLARRSHHSQDRPATACKDPSMEGDEMTEDIFTNDSDLMLGFPDGVLREQEEDAVSKSASLGEACLRTL